MPKGTKVHATYEALRRKGYDKGKAARIAQANTGQALATGKPPKHRKKPRSKAVKRMSRYFRGRSPRLTTAPDMFGD